MTLNKTFKGVIYSAAISLALLFALPVASHADTINIDSSSKDKGIVKVSVNVPGSTKIKMTVKKGDKQYVYDIVNDGSTDAFPLQLGNGDYQVTVLKNIGGTKYTPLKSENVSLSIDDPNTVYLQSIQNVEWNMSTQAVKKANALMEGYKAGNVKLEKVYEFVISNYKYDYDKAESVQTGYIPVVDDTYTSKKGICYDYSAMFAAMLRSNGIPTRLVKGYTVNVEGYHAWNEVYDEGSKSWIVIDTTYDAIIKLMKKKTTLKKSTDEYQTVNIY